MAKSIEQKAVDTLANALSDTRFRYSEFARLMSEQQPSIVHKPFFGLIVSYLSYISTSHKYGINVNNTAEEARLAHLLMPTIRNNINNT